MRRWEGARDGRPPTTAHHNTDHTAEEGVSSGEGDEAIFHLAPMCADKTRSIEEICSAIGISRASLYRYVKDWQEEEPRMILLPFGESSFVEALWPPMEEGGRADERGLRLERDTVLGLRLLQRLDGSEVPIDQRRIGERPEVFGGLQLGSIRRQEEQVGAIRFPETAGRQGMGSTPQGVTTCCPTSGAIPDPLGEGGTASSLR
jgi:predicted DNA-binding transcriptional regulator AlpA